MSGTLGMTSALAIRPRGLNIPVMEHHRTAKLKVQFEAKARKAAAKPKGVVAKTVTTAAGTKLKVASLNANSASFGADFLYVFKSNVRKARSKALAKRHGKPAPDVAG